MFSALRSILLRLFPIPTPAGGLGQGEPTYGAQGGIPVPYDEGLLERMRGCWALGNWGELTRIDPDSLQNHPDRAKLALLAAAGYQQMGEIVCAKAHVVRAREWGATKRMVSQVLISGAYNTIAKAAALAGQQPRALRHFRQSVVLAQPNGQDIESCLSERIGYQCALINRIALATIPHAQSGTLISKGGASTEVTSTQLNRELDALFHDPETDLDTLIAQVDRLPNPRNEQQIHLPDDERQVLSAFLQSAVAPGSLV